MIKVTLFVLLVSVCHSVFADVDEECTIKADAACIAIGGMIKKIESLKIQNIPPTKICLVKGISGIKLMGDKEVTTVKNDEGTRSKFHITLPHLEINCTLVLPKDPSKVPGVLVTGIEKAASSNCPPDKVDEVTKSIQNAKVPTMGLADMLKLTQCQPSIPFAESIPKVPKVGGGGSGGVSGGISIGRKRRDDGTAEGLIMIEWDDVKVCFDSLVEKGSTKLQITSVEVLSRDYDKIRVKCEEACDFFRKSCACVVATKAPVTMVVNIVYLILPCTVNGEAQKFDNFFKYFDCEN